MITDHVTAMSNHSMDSGDVFLSPKLNIRRFSFSRQQRQQAFCLDVSKNQQRKQPASVPEIRQQAFCLAVNKNQQRRQPASVPSYYRYSFNQYWKTNTSTKINNDGNQHQFPASIGILLISTGRQQKPTKNNKRQQKTNNVSSQRQFPAITGVLFHC